ncbi:MAG: GC-type dockerin domain-anchored protein [Planctomycetota bacterium]
MVPQAAAVVMVATTASGQTQTELFQLLPSTPSFFGNFGASLAIDGNLAVVGAVNDSEPLFAAGAAFVYDLTTGAERLKLQAENAQPSDTLGISAALEGTTAVIGASAAPVAYAFDAITGEQLKRFDVPGDPEITEFGFAVGISGPIVLVGDPLDSQSGPRAGAVHLFNLDTGTLFQTIRPSELEPGDSFGASIAVFDSVAMIGAPYRGEQPGRYGAAYVYSLQTGARLATITPPPGVEAVEFGESVAISAARYVVGAPQQVEDGLIAGAAYLYDRADASLITRFDGSDEGDLFGFSVTINESLLVISAPGKEVLVPEATGGTVNVYDALTGDYITELEVDRPEPSRFFGSALALSQTRVVATAPVDNSLENRSGAAYVFELACTQADLELPFGIVDLDDLDAFINAFLAGDASADFVEPPGVVDLDDLNAFIESFLTACP